MQVFPFSIYLIFFFPKAFFLFHFSFLFLASVATTTKNIAIIRVKKCLLLYNWKLLFGTCGYTVNRSYYNVMAFSFHNLIFKMGKAKKKIIPLCFATYMICSRFHATFFFLHKTWCTRIYYPSVSSVQL